MKNTKHYFVLTFVQFAGKKCPELLSFFPSIDHPGRTCRVFNIKFLLKPFACMAIVYVCGASARECVNTATLCSEEIMCMVIK